MKSDHQLYLLFSRCPGLFRAFLGQEIDDSYRFGSCDLKEISRTCDGLLLSSKPLEPATIVEFQMHRSAEVYPRIFVEMGQYQLENPDRIVRGLLVFASREIDPKPPTWASFAKTCEGGFRVLYLKEVVEDLDDNDPLKAVFQPFLVQDPEHVKQDANRWLGVIRTCTLPPRDKDVLEQVFFSWLTLIFNTLTKKEVMAMFAFDVPVEETVFYKEVKQEGREEGLEEGFEILSEAFRQLQVDPVVIAKALEIAEKCKTK